MLTGTEYFHPTVRCFVCLRTFSSHLLQHGSELPGQKRRNRIAQPADFRLVRYMHVDMKEKNLRITLFYCFPGDGQNGACRRVCTTDKGFEAVDQRREKNIKTQRGRCEKKGQKAAPPCEETEKKIPFHRK